MTGQAGIGCAARQQACRALRYHSQAGNGLADTQEDPTLERRACQLRQNLSIYDAGYVALAELTDATLVTLDRRISSAPGLRCTIATPDPKDP